MTVDAPELHNAVMASEVSTGSKGAASSAGGPPETAKLLPSSEGDKSQQMTPVYDLDEAIRLLPSSPAKEVYNMDEDFQEWVDKGDMKSWEIAAEEVTTVRPPNSLIDSTARHTIRSLGAVDVSRNPEGLGKGTMLASCLLFALLGFCVTKVCVPQGVQQGLLERLGLHPAGSRADDQVGIHPANAGALAKSKWWTAEPWDAGDEPYGYVLMTYSHPGQPDDHGLWSSVAMARMLQQVATEHVVLVLTDYESLPDGRSIADAFAKLSAEVVLTPRLYVSAADPDSQDYQDYLFHVQKLHLWRLTNFKKLVFLDTIALVYRNLDWLFQREGIWAAGNDWDCSGVANTDSVNTGIMMVNPNESDYKGLTEFFQERLNMDPVPNLHAGGAGDLFAQYFAGKSRRFNLLENVEAAYGRCLGVDQFTPFRDGAEVQVKGIWATPSYVHMSGGWRRKSQSQQETSDGYDNVCFSHNHTLLQRYSIGRTLINICHYHPLALQWRMAYCDAMKLVHVEGGDEPVEAKGFCDDTCYYHGDQAARTEGLRCGAALSSPSDLDQADLEDVEGDPAPEIVYLQG